MDREAIYSGLFAQWQALQTAGTFVTVDRKLRDFANVPSGIQPALYQLQSGEKVVQVRHRPPVVTLKVEIFIYAQSNDPSKAPSSVLNPLVDAVVGTVAPAYEGEDVNLNIEGVQHIWVEGDILVAEGVLENQAIAVIPVNILTV